MQGIEMRLKEAAVRDAVLSALAQNGLQATAGTRVEFVSGPGEPIVIAVTELETCGVRQAPAPPAPSAPATPAPSRPKPPAATAASKPVKASSVEEVLFGGQAPWPGAQPHLPEEDGKIAMPDAGKHGDGQLDDEEVVVFDSKRFAVDPVPAGEAPSLRSVTMRSYEVPDESDETPPEYRALPSPTDE